MSTPPHSASLGPGLAIARTLVREGAEHAMADYHRYTDPVEVDMTEPSLREQYASVLDAPDPTLGDRLRAMHDLPAGTLGYEYVEFYRRNGLTLPGDDPNMPALFVAHDMCHVIGGCEPSGQGEIALGPCSSASPTPTRTGWGSSATSPCTRPGSW